MKKLVPSILLCSVIGSNQASALETCEDFFLLNLAPDSICSTRTNKTLYKEKDSISIIDSSGKGIKLHLPSTDQELNLKEARTFCEAQGMRVPSVAELQEFVDETFSARFGGEVSCRNVNRSFLEAEASSSQGSKNIVPLEGKATWSQRDFEIAAFDFSTNTAVLRYEQQKFNAMCVEDMNKAPAFIPIDQHECSEYWLASTKVGTTCSIGNSQTTLTKTVSGFAFSDGKFISKPERFTSVASLEEARDHCRSRSMGLLNSKTLDYLLDGVTGKEFDQAPQIFCVDEFAGSETALVDDLNSEGLLEWNFTFNRKGSGAGSPLGYRVVCEN